MCSLLLARDSGSVLPSPIFAPDLFSNHSNLQGGLQSAAQTKCFSADEYVMLIFAGLSVDILKYKVYNWHYKSLAILGFTYNIVQRDA